MTVDSISNEAATATAYFDYARENLIALLPRPIGRVLDVGCGAGANAACLRAAGATYIEGIELVSEQAARAAKRFDCVMAGDFAAVADDLQGPFDSVLCLDVLEHMADPYSALRRLREVTVDGGHLQISIPNARHLSLVRDLVIHGTFGYTPTGHRDHTHLRWFTLQDLQAALTQTGWEPLRAGSGVLPRRKRIVVRLTRGRAAEFVVVQWYVTARAV